MSALWRNPWTWACVSLALFTLAVVILALSLTDSDGSPASNTGLGHGPGGDAPEALVSQLAQLPTYPGAVAESELSFDGFHVTAFYWIKEEDLDAVVSFYEKELQGLGWEETRSPSDLTVPLDLAEAPGYEADAPGATGAAPSPREIRSVRLSYGTTDMDVTIAVAKDPYQDPARGTIRVTVSLLPKV